MAWDILRSQIENIIGVYNGETIFDGDFIGAPIYHGDLDTIKNAPYNSHNLSRYGNSDSTGVWAEYYINIVNMCANPTNFNFSLLWNSMAVNVPLKIYNKNKGDSTRIEVYKSGGSQWAVRAVANGTSVIIGGYGIAGGLQWTRGPFEGIALLKNDTDGSMMAYCTLSYTEGGNPDYGQCSVVNNGLSAVNSVFVSYVLSVVFSDAYVPPTPPGPDSPYGDDDYTTSSGGDGGRDDTSDTISQDAIPIAAATRTGMCTAYVPNWGEITDVAHALLDPHWYQILTSNIVKFSDVIIGLSVFPCTIPASYEGTVKGNVIGIEMSTGVVSHIADDQYVGINCGDLTVEEYWGNCLDYNPYTKISIFLPFCGTYELDADEVMGKTLNVSYRIDIMSGACLATIKIDGSVFYQYSGQCSAQVPLSSVSFDQFLSSMIDLGVATATGAGAIGAGGAAVKEASKNFMMHPTAANGLAVGESRERLNEVKAQSGASILDAAVGAVMGSKGFYTHAGAMSGSPGFLGVRTPFLTIKRPEQLIPSMYGKFHGYPCNTTAVLGDLVGYTEIGDIRLNIPDATVEEILECEQLLKGGVVI